MRGTSATRRPRGPPSRSRSCRRARSSRWKRSHCSEGGRGSGRRRHNDAMKAIEEYVGGLGLDAYLVGGAVRDELRGVESKDADFLVAGVDIATLLAALSPHGRVEELVV